MTVAALDLWASWSNTIARISAFGDLMWTGAVPAADLQHRTDERAAALIDCARRLSSAYARHYRDCPPQARLADVPSIDRAQLMAQFDDWATDREITLGGVNRFLADTDAIGADYLGRYAVWTSSGTAGEGGIFVQSPQALAMYDVEMAARCRPGQVRAPALAPMLPAVLIAATAGHYAGVVAWRRMQRAAPWLATQLHAVSVALPLEQIVARLNRLQPKFISAYPTVLEALADEQHRGALHIAPALLWSGGECLTPPMRERIGTVFGCPLINDYGASECMSIGFECAHGRMHLNADWVVLEPVDECGRAVPPGRPSTTCLLTNLVNTVQPVIRYDLGDSITLYDRPCPCGCPLPSFSVSGRSGDVLHFPGRGGARTTLFPLAIQSAIEEGSGVTHFQLVQEAPTQLRLRIAPSQRADAQRARGALTELLAAHHLADVRIVLDDSPPQPDVPSGKLRQVVTLVSG